ncbi:hypothetical protein [Treponema zioleckii]|uniref:hypothetical protein n=1 Tax=Treponema zioleckii TaxID=331680 RepID=UPI00168AC79C|nr:hypothetical protein [Treponema zioleckii]
MTYGKYVRWQDLPDSPGKRVLEEILTTPPVDYEAMHQKSLQYQQELFDLWAEEDRQKAEQEAKVK